VVGEAQKRGWESMSKPASQQTVHPEVVRNSCIALIGTLARDASLSDDQITPALETLSAETLLPMFITTHLWAADCLARLTGIEPTVGLKENLQRFVSALPVGAAVLEALALKGDEAALLFLATAQDALRMMDTAIKKRLGTLPIGRQYVDFRKTSSEESLEWILKKISPKPSYYYIGVDTSDDRKMDIRDGFFAFVDRLKEMPIGGWEDFPHTVLGEHRPAPHPEWDSAAKEYFIDEIESALWNDLPVLNGKLEKAPLAMRDVVRGRYEEWYGIYRQMREGKTEKIKPHRLDLDLRSLGNEEDKESAQPEVTPLVLYESVDNPLDSEDVRDGGVSFVLDRKRDQEKIDFLKQTEPELYQALIETETEAGRFNIAAAARALGNITPQGLTKKLRKILQ